MLVASVGTPPYEYEALETKVATLSQEVALSLTDQDIAWAAADPEPAGRIELHLTDAAAARYGATLDTVNDGRVFRVVCGGRSLFLGVFYLIYGAAALHIPVLHEARENGVIVLRLGAVQGAWFMAPFADCSTECERIDQPELRAAFCRRGILRVLEPDARPGR